MSLGMTFALSGVKKDSRQCKCLISSGCGTLLASIHSGATSEQQSTNMSNHNCVKGAWMAIEMSVEQNEASPYRRHILLIYFLSIFTWFSSICLYFSSGDRCLINSLRVTQQQNYFFWLSCMYHVEGIPILRTAPSKGTLSKRQDEVTQILSSPLVAEGSSYIIHSWNKPLGYCISFLLLLHLLIPA